MEEHDLTKLVDERLPGEFGNLGLHEASSRQRRRAACP
jgi:hypothetical protein